jgi:hypothetical protein
MRGKIISWWQKERCFVIRPEPMTTGLGASVACDVLCSEEEIKEGGSKGLDVEFDLVPTGHGFRAVNVKAISDEHQD